MLHERAAEIAPYFSEGRECVMFDGSGEMIEAIKYFLKNPGQRDAIAEAGYARCHNSENSFDDRIESILNKGAELQTSLARRIVVLDPDAKRSRRLASAESRAPSPAEANFRD